MSELVGLGVTLLLAFFPFGSKGALLIKHFSSLTDEVSLYFSLSNKIFIDYHTY